MLIKPRTFLVNNYYKLIAHDKIRFLIVGGIGFVTNYLMLTLLYHVLKVPILVSQLVSAETALLATFVGNNFWSFIGHHHISIKTKLIKFHASAIGGLVINSSFVVIMVRYLHIYYGLALVTGSMAGLIWNYTLYKRFVFKTKKQPAEAD